MSDRRRMYAIGVVLAPIVTAVTALLLPSQLGAAVLAAAGHRSAVRPISSLTLLLLATLGADVTSTLATGAHVALGTADTRRRVAAGALHKPRSTGTADLVTRILVDARQPSAMLPMITSVVLSALTAVVALVLIALVDWILLVGVLAGLVSILFLLRRVVDDTATQIHGYRDAQARVGQALLDAQAGAASIRAYGTWRREVARILRSQPDVHEAGTRLWRTQARFASSSALVVPTLLLVTVGVGGWSFAHGRIDVGGYLAALGYTYLVLGGLDGIEAAAGLGVVRGSRHRLDDFLSTTYDDSASVPSVAHRSGPLGVVLDDVTVVRADGEPRLTATTLEIAAGSFVAITGASGSGRSTLAEIIAGVTTPTTGTVVVEGIPPFEGVRPGVFGRPRPAMLGEDIAGLIRLGGSVADESVHDAAKRAHLYDVITALPEGFRTPIADLTLSGGELQRLAIAQAVANSNGLLVLDDVTTALDPATEREVIGALLELRRDRTLVVVTDRAAVIDRADRVLTLENGHLVHQEASV